MKKRILSFFAIATLVSSCIMYHPQTVDMPLLQHKGDFHADVSAAISPLLIVTPTVDINASAAYGITDHIGAQAFASISNPKNGYFQMAAGGFQSLSNHAVVEGYLGFGNGWSHDNYESASFSETASGNYQIYYAQANFGWVGIANGRLDLGIGCKGGLFKPDLSSVRTDPDGALISESTATTNRALIEPQLMVRIGGEHVKLRIGLAAALFPFEPQDSYSFNYSPLNCSIGAHFRL